MTKNNDERKCAFGVFIDIVDNLQAMNKMDISQKRDSEPYNKECPFCSNEIESTEKICRHCGKAQPE
jgi:hypothetical protein